MSDWLRPTHPPPNRTHKTLNNGVLFVEQKEQAEVLLLAQI